MSVAHPLTIWTIGHSTRPFEEFGEILHAAAIGRVVDVRIWPHSRRYPWFDGPILAGALHAVDIGYTHLSGLGGHRRTRPDSPNTGWRNRSFRGYADYMQTSEFAAGLADLLALAGEARVAIMCAEALPWRCHRSLISDALVARRAGSGPPQPNECTGTPPGIVRPRDGYSPDVSGSGGRARRRTAQIVIPGSMKIRGTMPVGCC